MVIIESVLYMMFRYMESMDMIYNLVSHHNFKEI